MLALGFKSKAASKRTAEGCFEVDLPFLLGGDV